MEASSMLDARSCRANLNCGMEICIDWIDMKTNSNVIKGETLYSYNLSSTVSVPYVFNLLIGLRITVANNCVNGVCNAMLAVKCHIYVIY